ncbi:DedA family protein [Blastomonas sp.]|uniref:DedA family protein n=1 Tax=Blastomonas sp. TaxID=1909299 RepID=UPI003592F843
MSDFIVDLIARGGYLGIALLMALENVFPPIPSEVIMGLAGIEAGQGRMAFWGVIASGTIGSTAGNYVWYALGRWIGLGRVDTFVTRWGRWLTLDHAEIERFSIFFQRFGSITVLVARMLPTVRTLISLPAGLFRMSRLRFIVWTLLGTSVWNIVIAGIGFQLGRRVEQIDQYTGPVSTGIIGLIVVAYAVRVIFWRPKLVDTH